MDIDTLIAKLQAIKADPIYEGTSCVLITLGGGELIPLTAVSIVKNLTSRKVGAVMHVVNTMELSHSGH